jgi:DNA-binding FrmR family transcriptional regulator
MLEHPQRETLVARLNRIEGQLRGIRRMIEQPRPCIDLLQQLAAAEAALARISHSVLKFHVEHCVPQGVLKGSAEQHKQLKELVDIFDRRAR